MGSGTPAAPCSLRSAEAPADNVSGKIDNSDLIQFKLELSHLNQELYPDFLNPELSQFHPDLIPAVEVGVHDEALFLATTESKMSEPPNEAKI